MTGRRYGTRVVFGEYRFDHQQRLLERGGELVRLPPKALDLLDLLLSYGNGVAPREALLDALWPDTHVEEANLAKLVFLLRKELGPGADGRPFIETIPKRGYRFVGEVRAEEEARLQESGDRDPMSEAQATHPKRPTPTAQRRTAIAVLIVALAALAWTSLDRPRAARRTSVVVLPFTAGSSTDAQFASGISDFIGARLAHIPGVDVVPPALAGPGVDRSDARRVARKLGATLVLTGSVARTGDRIRVTYTISSPAGGSAVGAESFTAASSDIFELEERVAGSVAAVLELHRSTDYRSDPALRTPESQRAYIQALGLLAAPPDETDYAGVFSLLEPLAGHSAASPLVLSALGRAHLLRFRQGRSPRELDLAETLARRAAAAGGDLARVHALLGGVQLERGDLPRAIAELRTARAAEPNAVDILMELGRAYRVAGRIAEGDRTFDYLIRTHPECAVCFNSHGIYYARTKRRREAAAMFRRVIALDPEGVAGYVNLAAIESDMGHFSESTLLFRKATELAPNFGVAFYNLGETLLIERQFAGSAAAFGRATELEPGDARNWGRLADALVHVPGRSAEARRAYDRAIECARAELRAAPKNAQARAALAEFLAKRGERVDAATAEIRTALAAGDPTDETLLSAAAVATIAGDHARAVDYLERVATHDVSPQHFAREPLFTRLRDEPRFLKLIGEGR